MPSTSCTCMQQSLVNLTVGVLSCFLLFQKVKCPRYLSANDLLQCHVSGFHDPESGINHCRFFVGTAEGRQDVYQSNEIEECKGHLGIPGIVIAFCGGLFSRNIIFATTNYASRFLRNIYF